MRTLISLPAGIARMPLVPFLIYSAIGTVLWTGLLAASGCWLQENYALVADSVDHISKIIIGTASTPAATTAKTSSKLCADALTHAAGPSAAPADRPSTPGGR